MSKVQHRSWTSAEDRKLQELITSGAKITEIRADFRGRRHNEIVLKWQDYHGSNIDMDNPEIIRMLSDDPIRYHESMKKKQPKKLGLDTWKAPGKRYIGTLKSGL